MNNCCISGYVHTRIYVHLRTLSLNNMDLMGHTTQAVPAPNISFNYVPIQEITNVTVGDITYPYSSFFHSLFHLLKCNSTFCHFYASVLQIDAVTLFSNPVLPSLLLSLSHRTKFLPVSIMDFLVTPGNMTPDNGGMAISSSIAIMKYT